MTTTNEATETRAAEPEAAGRVRTVATGEDVHRIEVVSRWTLTIDPDQGELPYALTLVATYVNADKATATPPTLIARTRTAPAAYAIAGPHTRWTVLN